MAFGLTPWDPFRDLERIDRLMRRSFEPFLGRLTQETIASPAVELTDEGDHYLVKAEIPGVPADAVEITLNGNVLTLRGEKRYERQAGSAPESGQGQQRGQEQSRQQRQQQSQQAGQQEGQQARGSTAVAKAEPAGELSRPIFSEVFYGRFERVLTLPDDIDPNRIEAEARDGVFFVTIGKKAEQRARRIQVTVH